MKSYGLVFESASFQSISDKLKYFHPNINYVQLPRNVKYRRSPRLSSWPHGKVHRYGNDCAICQTSHQASLVWCQARRSNVSFTRRVNTHQSEVIRSPYLETTTGSTTDEEASIGCHSDIRDFVINSNFSEKFSIDCEGSQLTSIIWRIIDNHIAIATDFD